MLNIRNLSETEVSQLFPEAYREAEGYGFVDFYASPPGFGEENTVIVDGTAMVLYASEESLDDEENESCFEWDPQLESWIDTSRF